MKNTGFIAVLVICAVVIYGQKGGEFKFELPDFGKLIPTIHTSVDPVPEPSAEVKALVTPLIEIVKKGKPEHAVLLANFFRDFGDVVISDPLFPTNADVKLACENAAKRLLTKYNLGGTYPGFSELLFSKDGIVIKYIGNNPKAIDAVKAKALFQGLQWACSEAAK
jgi:hypothetical protein